MGLNKQPAISVTYELGGSRAGFAFKLRYAQNGR